jgi:hypothetical protein
LPTSPIHAILTDREGDTVARSGLQSAQQGLIKLAIPLPT